MCMQKSALAENGIIKSGVVFRTKPLEKRV